MRSMPSTASGDSPRENAIPATLRDLPFLVLRPLESRVTPNPASAAGLPGYLAMSTAAANVEDGFPEGLDPQGMGPAALCRETDRHLEEIAALLADRSGNPEVVIAVHGFCNDLKGAEAWYRDIHGWVSGQSDLACRNVVFLGYRWPAENIFDRLLQRVRDSFSALPTLPRWLLLFHGLAALALIGVLLSGWVGGVAVPLLTLATGVAAIVLTLVLLRLVVYFRDTYRSSYYGIPDLVELLRQLDGVIARKEMKQRVKLSFLAHSLGNSVVTGTIRVLANAFEAEAVGTLNGHLPGKDPSSDIGQSFRLERMVLVAPDIPVESVIPRRSNGLRSALRRMHESHVFTNEGDLALRLASTAANFFSFPARTRYGGYRLGNLTLRHFADQDDRRGQHPHYGIAADASGSPDLPVKHLEIRASDAEHRSLTEVPFAPWVASVEQHVTNRLSYYDCTDAIHQGRGLVSQARRVRALNLLGYVRLTLAYLLFNVNSSWGVDTHGGYFRGETGRLLIYRLAFAGFDELLRSLAVQQSDLESFCRHHQIQLALALRDQHSLALFLAEERNVGAPAARVPGHSPSLVSEGESALVQQGSLRLPLPAGSYEILKRGDGAPAIRIRRKNEQAAYE